MTLVCACVRVCLFVCLFVFCNVIRNQNGEFKNKSKTSTLTIYNNKLMFRYFWIRSPYFPFTRNLTIIWGVKIQTIDINWSSTSVLWFKFLFGLSSHLRIISVYCIACTQISYWCKLKIIWDQVQWPWGTPGVTGVLLDLFPQGLVFTLCSAI